MAEDFFGNLSKTLKKTVDTVGKKTDEFVEIQKIRTRQHALEDQIQFRPRAEDDGRWRGSGLGSAHAVCAGCICAGSPRMAALECCP